MVTPQKPIATANQRYAGTRSFNINAASTIVISGDAKPMAITSTSCSRASAAKVRNMPAMLIRPYKTCPSGRSVRTAAMSSPRQPQTTTIGTIAKALRKKTTCPTGMASPRNRTSGPVTGNS